MNTDTQNFLESLLFVASNDGTPHIATWSIYEFHPEFVEAVGVFLSGFRAYLQTKVDAIMDETENDSMTDEQAERLESMLDPDLCDRSFGGNVFFSLSGHGCGFWDDYSFDGPDKSARGKALQSALETYSGNKYRFEDLQSNLAKFHGKIHLAYRTAAFRREYLQKTFGNTFPA